uniref:MACRO domain-containing protein 2 n=1 Tax=Lygus hesperus TaxID=30085 RepID=A0A0A9YFI3_LYGHE
MKVVFVLALLVALSQEQFVEQTPVSLLTKLEGQIKEISDILAKVPPPCNKEDLEVLKKDAESALPDLKEEKESGWTEIGGCSRKKCFDVLTKGIEISDKMTKELAHPEGNKIETVETKHEVPITTSTKTS